MEWYYYLWFLHVIDIYKAVHMYRQELDEKMQLNNQAMQSLAEGHARMSRKIEKLEQEKRSGS